MEDTLSAKLASYQPDDVAIQIIKATRLLLLVGPTGAGKDTLKDELLKDEHYHHIVSHTTRQPRMNHGIPERDGVEYHFIDKKRAEQMLDNHEFIEAKIYSGNLYGTSVDELRIARELNKVAMTDIEVQGVKEYKMLDSNVMAIFLLPPNFQIWQERLTRRYGDVVDIKDHRLRLETALAEIDELLNTDYYVAVVNDDLNQTYNQACAIAVDQIKPDESRARVVAKELERDIKAYLAE